MLTPKQDSVLRVFREHIEAHGCAPTLDQVASQLGITKTTAYEHVKAMVRKGVLNRDRPNTRAAYTPVEICPTCGQSMKGGSE